MDPAPSLPFRAIPDTGRTHSEAYDRIALNVQYGRGFRGDLVQLSVGTLGSWHGGSPGVRAGSDDQRQLAVEQIQQ